MRTYPLTKKLTILLGIVFVVLSCKHDSFNVETVDKSAYDLVNPFIGTGGHGHTFPGATMPFGMVQLSPDTRLDGWDGCSGYHNSDSIIFGFSHTHLSGTGVSDYGDILLMPFNYSNTPSYDDVLNNKMYSSIFKKTSEKANPGYYKVHLDHSNVEVELTATKRVGIHQYTFENSKDRKILLDLNHRDKVLDFEITVENDRTITGKRISESWAREQHIYFVINFSESFVAKSPVNRMDRDDLFKILSFRDNSKKLVIKVGISAVSIDGAKANLVEEASHWDFQKYKTDAKNEWEKELNKIKIKGKDEDKLSIFYTALYHTMIAPNVFSDVDGNYRGLDHQIHFTSKKKIYTVFSLWDTFRATHPLYTIIDQKRTNEFINTFLIQYTQGKKLPVWELAANETNCMIGYHSVPVIVDAYMKEIRDYDEQLAMEAMINSANSNLHGLEFYKKQGFIAAGDESESVSKTLEYAYDDWCIATMANEIKNTPIFEEFIYRGQYYKNCFNPANGFMQSKMNGGWTNGFDPAEVNFNYTEANAWQYSMFVPQDIKGLISLHGGAKKIEQKLDELFSTETVLKGREQVDITGLIGQYAHGNEPSHHMAYLYNYVGKPYKTQKRIHQIVNEQYTNKPDGLAGNEDCGQMSAWYVLSTLGFYSVTPGLTYYSIGTPFFDEVIINLENGKQFKIIAHNVSNRNMYIQSASINGKQLNKAILYHQQIMEGGELVFEMGPNPNKSWGVQNMPVSEISKKYHITPVPYFTSSSQTFEDQMEVELKSIVSGASIFYKIANEFIPYKKPIIIHSTSTIEAYAILNGNKSFMVSASYKKIVSGRSIRLLSKYDNQYNAGGDKGLIDHLKGSSNFRTGFWQGYYGKDIEAIVDLGGPTSVSTISVGALQDIKSWIFFPSQVELFVSTDGISFQKLKLLKNDFPSNEYGEFIREFSYLLPRPKQIQFVKIIAKNFGKCPDWHLGKGENTWLFLDEITIE